MGVVQVIIIILPVCLLIMYLLASEILFKYGLVLLNVDKYLLRRETNRHLPKQ